MLPARPPFMPLLRRLDAIVARCHRLIERARNPYRPERHYMRGPGPKWHEKHAQKAPDPVSPDFEGLYEPR